MPTLTLPKPHAGQQQVIDGSKRFNVLCCGRRWGKTELGDPQRSSIEDLFASCNN